jgi:hypothetical protein
MKTKNCKTNEDALSRNTFEHSEAGFWGLAPIQERRRKSDAPLVLRGPLPRRQSPRIDS